MTHGHEGADRDRVKPRSRRLVGPRLLAVPQVHLRRRCGSSRRGDTADMRTAMTTSQTYPARIAAAKR